MFYRTIFYDYITSSILKQPNVYVLVHMYSVISVGDLLTLPIKATILKTAPMKRMEATFTNNQKRLRLDLMRAVILVPKLWPLFWS